MLPRPSVRAAHYCACAVVQPMSADSKEMLKSMVEPVSKFFEETNDASKNDETAEVPAEVCHTLRYCLMCCAVLAPCATASCSDAASPRLKPSTAVAVCCAAADLRGAARDGRVRSAGP